MEKSYQEKDLVEIASLLIKNLPNKIVAFNAPMGAGKTTLIKAIVSELGSLDDVSSPTFGLVNEYHDKDDNLLAYHFDFYRLKDESEALDMGFEDYLRSDAWIFIEWPEKIPSFLPLDSSQINIKIINPTTRQLTF
ncbi:tRNA (adenosine(37)-N6)-threonylcarbamoyltransferase complex ATPase subunit type 1 TsaE [Maribacter sp. CXY002]|uniref:tRNA (adenosine(37)-N6)-threonylcarbamoyltransferase complex ATPase subunit type 1 TsaE n=1 Tax=Maribacter luteocoastalis TaxID=3407671 RepID=UPI003B66EE94